MRESAWRFFFAKSEKIVWRFLFVFLASILLVESTHFWRFSKKMDYESIHTWICSLKSSWWNRFMNQSKEKSSNHESIYKLIREWRIYSWINLSLLYHVKYENEDYPRLCKMSKSIQESIHVAINWFLNQFKKMRS